jgi:hypothetical protein
MRPCPFCPFATGTCVDCTPGAGAPNKSSWSSSVLARNYSARAAATASAKQKRLEDLAATLGPLPHARLNIDRGSDNRGPADRDKKQTTRMLKAECAAEGCGYTVRVASKWVKDKGPPLCPCPDHGAMAVDFPEGDKVEPEAGELREAV